MNWFLLALLAPLAWSIANYLDKYLLSSSTNEGEGGSGGLLILSSVVSLLAAFAVFLVQGKTGLILDSQQIGVLVLSGVFEALYILFYFWALAKESTTTVISLFQFSPIMGLLFGYFLLAEVPTPMQFLAIGVILLGTLLIVFKKGERFSLKGNILLLMLVSTAFVGLYNTLFKVVAEHTPFWTAIFWQYIGIGGIGFLLFASSPEYRKETFQMLGRRSGKTLLLTISAELLNIGALLFTNAAILLAPVALVLSVSSVQPLFVLIEGFIIAALFPKFLDPAEKPSLRLQYLAGILLVCIGGFLIYYQA